MTYVDTKTIIAHEDTFQVPTYDKFPIAVAKGSGCYLWDTDGNRYLDFYGGHCVTPLGHCPPRVVDAIKRQSGDLIFYSNVVYSPVRARAARLLVDISPPGIEQVFFCNSGTEANETALKLARKSTGKKNVIAFEGGFHGRTLGSLATTWNPKYRAPYADVLAPTFFAPFNDAAFVRGLMERVGDVAAVILEPIQSMAGIIEASNKFVSELRSMCDVHDSMLIFDEVQTGVGRTGTFSIAEQLGVTPDLITMAKSLGSGLPVGAVLATGNVARSVELGDQGSTFGGGMLAMAAVEATLETLLDEGLLANASAVFSRIAAGLDGLATSVRGRGCLIGVELDRPAAGVATALRERFVLTGTSADPRVIRLMPPLNTPDEAVDEFLEALRAVLARNVVGSES